MVQSKNKEGNLWEGPMEGSHTSFKKKTIANLITLALSLGFDSTSTWAYKHSFGSSSVQRRATGWTAGFRFPSGAGDFPSLHNVQNGSVAHLTSYLRDSGGYSLRAKAAGTWNWSLTSN
jgi:hypothetical protein